MNRRIQKFLINISNSSGVQSFLDKNMAISQYLMGIGSGSYPDTSGEAAIMNKLRQHYIRISRPLCIFDIGANQGQFLSLVEQLLQGIPFQAHSFEPSLHTFSILCENARDYTNAVLINRGIGKETGEFELFYDTPGSSLASLSRRHLEHYNYDFSCSEKVTLDTVDNYCSNNGIDSIDLLKIDIEGHELDALTGATEMFEKRAIHMATFEFGGCNIDTRTYFKDFWYFFEEMGMKQVFRVTPSGYLFPINRYRERHEQFTTTNFLVMRDG